ncbi:MAG: AIR carboxylase family protein [Alphaproteobacteria bacterium]|nr:AIR carboxylase family protein [Alphaproteobacteria bacterium]
MAFVPILMGSRSDLEHGQAVADALAALGIDSELRVCSAHKVPVYLMGLLDAYEADSRPKVYVTIAGRSNALSAFVDAYVLAPVIACPPYSSKFSGGDIFSSLRMPSGVAPLTVLDPKGAALAAAKVFGVTDPAIRQAVAALHLANQRRLEADDKALLAEQAEG